VGGVAVTDTRQGPTPATGSSSAHIQSYDGESLPDTWGDGAEASVMWSWRWYAALQGALEETPGNISCGGIMYLICVKPPAGTFPLQNGLKQGDALTSLLNMPLGIFK